MILSILRRIRDFDLGDWATYSESSFWVFLVCLWLFVLLWVILGFYRVFGDFDYPPFCGAFGGF